MNKVVWIVLALLLSFGGGYALANWNFLHPEVYVSKETISLITDGAVSGSLPRGTRLYYRSFGHDEVGFYVFIRLPIEKAKPNVKKLESDSGIRSLQGDFK